MADKLARGDVVDSKKIHGWHSQPLVHGVRGSCGSCQSCSRRDKLGRRAMEAEQFNQTLAVAHTPYNRHAGKLVVRIIGDFNHEGREEHEGWNLKLRALRVVRDLKRAIGEFKLQLRLHSGYTPGACYRDKTAATIRCTRAANGGSSLENEARRTDELGPFAA